MLTEEDIANFKSEVERVIHLMWQHNTQASAPFRITKTAVVSDQIYLHANRNWEINLGGGCFMLVRDMEMNQLLHKLLKKFVSEVSGLELSDKCKCFLKSEPSIFEKFLNALKNVTI